MNLRLLYGLSSKWVILETKKKFNRILANHYFGRGCGCGNHTANPYSIWGFNLDLFQPRKKFITRKARDVQRRASIN